MTGEVIKEFLVGLGFGIDEAGLKKFTETIKGAAVRVGLIASAVGAAAAGIFAGVTNISEGFEQMGYEYRIIAPMLNRTLQLRQALLKAYGQAGINITKAVQQSVIFNFSLAKTKFQLEGIYKSVGMKFLPMLTKQMDIFRGKVVANMPAILKFLSGVVQLVFSAFEMITILGTRLYELFKKVWDGLKALDDATNGWSTKIMLVYAAWKILNLAFLSTPIGILITSIVALIALYDDFMVWKEGGESLIDWGDKMQGTLGVLIAVIAGIAPAIAIAKLAMAAWATVTSVASGIASAFGAVMSVVRTAVLLFNLALYANPIGVIIAAVVAGLALLAGAAYLVYKNWDSIKEWFSSFFTWIGDKFKALGKWVGIFTGGGETDINVNKTLTTAPLGSGGGAAQTVSQKTEINIQTSSDPQAIASATSNAQSRVNQDLARNLKGAAR